MLVRIANMEDPDQTASSESSLIWICTVCLCLFGKQLVFKDLEHLPYLMNMLLGLIGPAKQKIWEGS